MSATTPQPVQDPTTPAGPELDQPMATLAEPHPELYSCEAAVNGDYPAVVHEAGEDCAPCEASAAFYARLDAENDARWARAEHAPEPPDPEAGQ